MKLRKSKINFKSIFPWLNGDLIEILINIDLKNDPNNF